MFVALQIIFQKLQKFMQGIEIPWHNCLNLKTHKVVRCTFKELKCTICDFLQFSLPFTETFFKSMR